MSRPHMGSRNSEVTRWEHGFRTRYVVATRMTGEHAGFFISFKFPLHPDQCDREDLLACVHSLGGAILSCGGWPGAPINARFASMPDIASANDLLPTILPKLNSFVERNLEGQVPGRGQFGTAWLTAAALNLFFLNRPK